MLKPRLNALASSASCLLIMLQALYCIHAADCAETNIQKYIKTLGVSEENISYALDLLATDPQQSTRLLIVELHPIPRKTYFEATKTPESKHVIACLRALHYLTGTTFSATSTAKLSDDEKQFLDFHNQMHDDNPGHALHFFGVWMSRNADIVAPTDAQRNIIKRWKLWGSQHGNTVNSVPSGKAAQKMDEWYWFG
jgi:hypothetical protein